MKNKLKDSLKSKSVLVGLAVVIIVALILVFKNAADKQESVAIKRGEFIKTVSVSGKVVAAQSVDLSFETGGTVVTVNKKAGEQVVAGQVITSLNSADILANRDKAKADLEAARAELMKLKSGNSFDTETDVNRRKLVNSINDAYTKADDAIHNKVDQYFRGGYLDYPDIIYNFFGYIDKEADINYARSAAEKTLVKFSKLVSGLTIDNYTAGKLSDTKIYLSEIKAFLDKLAPVVNTFYVGVNDLTQTSADKYKSDLATARFNINESISSIASYEGDLSSSVSEIAVKEANISAAEANVRSYDAELGKMVIRAPFGGVISRQDAKVGQAVSANSVVTSLLSNNLEVEVFVPEISLPGIGVGNKATVVFDAYPDKTFEALVIHIDPAETEKDGVSNYKVRLSLNKSDKSIVSGLTADVFIETERKPDTLLIPERSVLIVDGVTYVLKRQDKENVKTEVILGAKDGKGNAEVIGGLNVGDTILVNPVQD